MSIGFVCPELGRVSGGSLYNERVLAAWPTDAPRPEAIRLTSADGLAGALARHDVVVVDGLFGCRAADALAAAERAGHRIVLLVHMAQPARDGAVGATATLAAEAAALAAASAVVATSRHTASILRARRPGMDLAVATPGIDPAPLATPHEPPTLLQVGSIGPLKNQGLVLAAAARCADLDFRLRFVGPDVDPAYAAGLRERALDALPARVDFPGTVTGADLDNAYLGADLVLSVAHAEAYGMTVLEALAHGLPAVVGRGTGAVEALTAGGGVPGAQVFTDRVDELADVLRTWLTAPELRRRWRASAVGAREHLPRWSEAAAGIAAVCAGLSRS